MKLKLTLQYIEGLLPKYRILMSDHKESSGGFEGLDLSYLHTISRGDAQLEKNLLQVLAEDLPVQKDELQQAITEQQSTTAGELGHKMKTSFKMIGLTAAAELLEQIELDCADKPDFSTIAAYWSQFLALYEPAMAELQTLLQQH